MSETEHDNSYAVMCIYCGEAVIYDTRNVIDMEAAHSKLMKHDQSCPENPLVAEIERLRRENAELEEVRKQNLELEARIHELACWIRQDHLYPVGIDAAGDVVETVPEEIAHILDRLPSQSLANIRAEAVEEANQHLVSKGIRPTHVALHKYAQSLREREDKS